MSEQRIPVIKLVTWRHPERLLPNRKHLPLAHRIIEFEPDVVHSHLDWDYIPTTVRACRAARVPLIHTFHGYNPERMGVKALAPLSWTEAPVSAVSAALKERLSSLHRCVVIPNGVDVEAAKNAEPLRRARSYVFCASRLDFRTKAIDVLIAAFGSIASEHPELDLLIAGAGPDSEKLERQVMEAGLGERVFFLGALPHSELWKLYKGALFFAMPSRRFEGLGNVFLESMASGKAAIGSKLGGVPEVILDGETGLLIESEEPAELAQAMRTMLDHPGMRQAMGRRGQELAARHGWTAVAEQYLQLYGSVLKRERHRSASLADSFRYGKTVPDR